MDTNPPTDADNGKVSVVSRGLQALAHPVTLTCILLLLLNDQLLRVHWPSRLTGKLGDVAWLAFAPLVIALPLALVASRLWPHRREDVQGRRVITLAALATALVFAGVKAIPTATAAFRDAFRTAFGWEPLIVCDPTDLLALPALGLALWTWHRTAPASARRVIPRRRAMVGLALAALATLGNSGPPDEGIVCLQMEGTRVIAGPQHDYAFTNVFATEDGGLTWVELEDRYPGEEAVICELAADAWPLQLADGTLIRYLPGRAIERSTDGGATWERELRLAGEQARLAYNQTQHYQIGASYGPHALLTDPATGNLVIAMGLEGVLVREPSGTWHWSTVGPYRHEPITGLAQLLALLPGELMLAIAAASVAVALAGWRTLGWPLRVLGILGGAGIVGVALFLSPAMQTGYGRSIAVLGSAAAMATTLILGSVALVIQLRRQRSGGRRRLTLAVPAALGGALALIAYLLPFLLWAFGAIPAYATAMWIAVVLAGAVWLGSALGSATSARSESPSKS